MKKLFKNKKLIIGVSIILLVVIVGSSTYTYRNYNAYNNYMVEFEKYGYSNNDFWEENKLVKPETLSYMQYELDKVAKESNYIIQTVQEKYPDIEIDESKNIKDQLSDIEKYLDKKISEYNITVTDKTNDTEKKEATELKERISSLTENNDLSIIEKMDKIEELEVLKTDVDTFNKKVSDRIAKEEAKKKEEEKQQSSSNTTSNSWNSNSSNSWSSSSGSNSGSSNNSTNSSSNGNSNGGCNGRYCNCPYKSQQAAINAGEQSGRGYKVQLCDDGTYSIYLFDGDNTGNNNGWHFGD